MCIKKLKLFRELFKTWITGKYFGDIAGIKVALANPSEDENLRLKVTSVLVERGPSYDLDFLLSCPDHSLGKKYGEFLSSNNIQIVRFSGKYISTFSRYPVSIRYIQWTWGRNNQGQLGQGNSGSGTHRSSPVQVGTDTTWENVTGSDRRLSVAIKKH